MERIAAQLWEFVKESVDISDMVEYSDKFAIPLSFCLEKRPDLINHCEFLEKYLDGKGVFKDVVIAAMNSKNNLAIDLIINRLSVDRDTRKLKRMIGILRHGGFDEDFLERIINLRERIISEGNRESYSREDVMKQLFSKLQSMKERQGHNL